MSTTTTTTTTTTMTKKQGAYGAVPTHRHSVWEQLSKPSEVVALARMALWYKTRKARGGKTRPEWSKLEESLWEHLDRTSRSFAMVIRVLPPDAADAVCVFYLVLRALDTLEDDMELEHFAGLVSSHAGTTETTLAAKQRLLETFHELFLEKDKQPTHKKKFPLEQVVASPIGKGDEHALLEALPGLVDAFHTKIPSSRVREAVHRVVCEMGQGMAEFSAMDLGRGTSSVGEYNRYCHFVAGTVGYGLTAIFDALGLEQNASELVKDQRLWDGMGMLLQKTNIIRDVCEDAAEGRAFWPQDVWRNNDNNNNNSGAGASLVKELGDVRDVRVLNTLVTDALTLVPHVVAYLSRLHHPGVLRFCALPQVMALRTLEECYDNKLVFTGVVKIRAGSSARIVLALEQSDAVDVHRAYALEMCDALRSIRAKAKARTDDACVQACDESLQSFVRAGLVTPDEVHGKRALAVAALASQSTTTAVTVSVATGALYLAAVFNIWTDMLSSEWLANIVKANEARVGGEETAHTLAAAASLAAASVVCSCALLVMVAVLR